MAGAQPREYVFLGWSLLLGAGDYAAFGENIPVLAAAAQRGLCDSLGAFDRTFGEPGLSGVGLPGAALSLSWADLSDLFFIVAASVFSGHDAPWFGGKVPRPATVSQFPFVGRAVLADTFGTGRLVKIVMPLGLPDKWQFGGGIAVFRRMCYTDLKGSEHP